MGTVIATCGHTLTEDEGIGEPCWSNTWQPGEWCWLVLCKECRPKYESKEGPSALTPEEKATVAMLSHKASDCGGVDCPEHHQESLEKRAALTPEERLAAWTGAKRRETGFASAVDRGLDRVLSAQLKKALAAGEAERQRLLTEIAALKIALHHQQVAMRRAINICQGHQAAGCNAPLGAALILSEALGAVAKER